VIEEIRRNEKMVSAPFAKDLEFTRAYSQPLGITNLTGIKALIL
jgi:hypothetical protein